MLGASGLGDYSFAESAGRYAALFIEYGFALSATREIARHRNDVKARSELLAGVLGAQFLIVLCICILALLSWFGAPGFWSQNSLFVAAGAWAIFEGCGLMWYFQGLEQIRLVAAVDIAAKLCAIIGVFLFVRQPSDVWKVLGLRAAAAAMSIGMGLAIAYRDLPWTAPNLSRSIGALRNGVTMFVYRSSTALSTAANVLVLGLVAPPHVVGYYAGAEKISKASISLLQPVTQALLPRISHAVSGKTGQSDRLARLGFILMTVGGLGLGAVTFILAPWIVRVFLGKGFEPTIAVLRVLALLQPVAALNSMLGIQWMLPLRMDRVFNGIAISAGLLNVALCFLLSNLWAESGPAWAVLLAQSFALLLTLFILCRRGILPILGSTANKTRGVVCSQ
jgi:PST family polysaccharide transporter